MVPTSLQQVAEEIVSRAQQQGFILAREVREELSRAGLSEQLYKDVLSLARGSLQHRRGRYYYCSPDNERIQTQHTLQQEIRAAVEPLIQYQQAILRRDERREQNRIDFVQPVQVITEDDRRFTLLTRDLSLTGIRLIGTRRLLGQKVRVLITLPGQPLLEFNVRILWTCSVGDDLVENGGSFLSATIHKG